MLCTIPLIVAMIVAGVSRSSVLVTDFSELNSPVVFSGTATATDEIEAGKINYAFEVTLLAKSVSRQDILLMGFQVDLTSANYGRTQYTNIDDRFFSLNAIKEGQVETLNRTLGPVSSSAANTELRSTSPTAEARVVFVQFLDGSIWGDTERAQAALDQRRATVNELERLLVVFRTKNEAEFATELMRKSTLQIIESLQASYLKRKDAGLIARRIEEMLRASELHGQHGSPRAHREPQQLHPDQ